MKSHSLAVGLVLILAGSYSAIVAQPPMQAAPPQNSAPLMPPQQLDNLVAPIALYPDPLLSQVLVASTYPLEVVEAQQWLQKTNGLSGSALLDAAKQQNWDPSVQALVAFPDVLAKLNQDIRWTTDLGNAFLAQQADVMSAVQRMRAQAQSNGRLSTTPQQIVTTATDNGQAAIQIEPANPEVIYVPTYDPMYVWGPPAWGYYPPLYYPAFGFGFGPGLDIGLCFGGWGYGGFGWGGWGGWGWGPNWFGRSVFVNGAFFHNYGFRGGFGGGFAGRALWSHDPGHRLGVAYPNRQLAGRYGAASQAGLARSFGRTGGLNSFGQAGGRQYGGGVRGAQAGGGQYRGSQFASRSAAPGSQGFRGGAANQGGARSFQSRPSYQGAPGGAAARSFAGSNPRSFAGGGGQRNFAAGGGAPRSFSGGGGAPRSFNGGGGAPRSFSGGGGGAPRSFGGGGGGRSFGGGGGGGHASSGGGGGHSSGGGGGHGRR
jgi:hypothetical protein